MRLENAAVIFKDALFVFGIVPVEFAIVISVIDPHACLFALISRIHGVNNARVCRRAHGRKGGISHDVTYALTKKPAREPNAAPTGPNRGTVYQAIEKFTAMPMMAAGV